MARITTAPIAQLAATTLVPPHLYTIDAFPHLGGGVEGRPIPYGLGTTVLRPVLIDTTVGLGKYQWGDPTLMTTKSLNGIVALQRDQDKIGRTPIPVSDYTLDLTQNTVVINSNFPFDTFDIEVDVTGKPDTSGQFGAVGAAITAFGPVVSTLLQDFLGVPPAKIDISGAASETKPLTVWLGVRGEQRTLGDVINSSLENFPSVARSVNGRVQANHDGSWLVRAFNTTFDPVTGITLQRSDLVRFAADADETPIYWKALVYYNQNLSTEDFPYQQATSRATQYAFEMVETTGILKIYSYLRLATDAALVAAQTLAYQTGPHTHYIVEERTNKLFTARSGDICRITTTPAMHPSGSFTNEDFWIDRLQKTLTPDPRVIAGVRRVATAVQVDPVAIIPLLHWTGPTGVGVQDMRANPVLPFTTPGTYTITVDANMTLLLRGVAGGAGGGGGSWNQFTSPGDGASGGSGGSMNLVGERVVLVQGTTYALTVGAKGAGGGGFVGVAGFDGGDGGDTAFGVQGGTKYFDLQGGRHGRTVGSGVHQNPVPAGRARVGANSRDGGIGGGGSPFGGAAGGGSAVPGGGGGGGGGAAGYPNDGATGGKGGNNGQLGQVGSHDDVQQEAYGGHGGDGAGVAVTDLPGVYGGGGGGGGNVGGGFAPSSSNGRAGQNGAAVFRFVSVP